MKRLTSIFLILALLCCLLAVPAMAAVEAASTPMYQWDANAWSQAKSWTDEAWIAYFAKVEKMSLQEDYYGLLDKAMEQWTEEQWELYDHGQEVYWDNYDWDAAWQESQRLQKTLLGFPDPDGINVKLNGAFLTFEDASPALVDGRTMLPFRAILEAMGADVSYDSENRMATAVKGERTLCLTLDSTEMQMEEAGETHVIEMDVAPYLEEKTGRIYVPVRFLADALDYNVYWNDSYELVQLIDSTALADEIDASFTILNRLMASEAERFGKSYRTDLVAEARASLYGDKEPMSASAKAKGRMVSKGFSYAMDYELAVDLGAFRDMAVEIFGQETVAAFEKTWSELSFEMRHDGATGTAYVRSDLLKMTYDWLKGDEWMSTPTGLDQLAPLFLAGDAPTMGGMIAAIGAMDLSYSTTIYEDISRMSQYIALFVGDQAFTEKHDGLNVTYTARNDLAGIFKAIADLEGLDEETAALMAEDMFSVFESGSYELTLTERAGVCIASTFEMELDGAPMVPITIHMEMDSTQSKATYYIGLIGDVIGKFEVEGAATVSEVTAEPVPVPGEEDAVYTQEELEEELWRRWEEQWYPASSAAPALPAAPAA